MSDISDTFVVRLFSSWKYVFNLWMEREQKGTKSNESTDLSQSADYSWWCTLIRIFLLQDMYRLIPRMSKYILSNVDFIRSIANTRHNIHIHKNIFTKSWRLNMTKRHYFYNDHKSQGEKFKIFLAVSLPTLIFNFLVGIEDSDEEVPEVIMMIKRSVLLIQVRYWNVSSVIYTYIYISHHILIWISYSFSKICFPFTEGRIH